MSDFFVLKKIDSQLHTILNNANFFEVNPSNIEDERKKFFEDPSYNPVFQYPELPVDPEMVEDALHSVDEHDSVLGALLEKKRNIFIDHCEMIKHRGHPRFSIFARKIHGLPSKQTMGKAAEYLMIETPDEDSTIESQAAANMLQAEINHYGFNYSVHRREMSANAFVNIPKQMIFLKTSHVFSNNYIKRLTVHEIGTHILRAENGKQQPFQLFVHGFPDYLATEEGLAVINEERFGLLSNYQIKQYAARTIAAKMAQTKGFREVYDYLVNFLGPGEVFKIVLRAKRGVEDTSKPGGYPKDFVYLKGYLALKELIGDRKDNGAFVDSLVTSLYHGKIGIDHIDCLQHIPGICKPKHLPKNQTFKSLLSF